MGKIVQAIGHNLANVHRFDGREPKGRYWRFALPVLILYAVGSIAVMAPFAAALWRGFVHAVQNPPKPGSEPADDVAAVQMMIPDLDALTRQMADLSMALFLLTFLVLAAATVRRLHDRGRTGWWVVLPLPFYIANYVFAPTGTEAMAPQWDAQLWLMTISGYAGMGALVWLIVQAASDGRSGDNRFGSEPEPA